MEDVPQGGIGFLERREREREGEVENMKKKRVVLFI